MLHERKTHSHNNTAPIFMSIRRSKIFTMCIFVVLSLASHSVASEIGAPSQIRHQSVPILGVTFNESNHPVGIVMYVMIHFQKRSDHDGLKVQVRKVLGRFGPLARKGVATAIGRAAQSANLQTDSWTVVLSFPYPGLTMYGDSLSATVALSVVALAKGDAVKYGRTLTGTITDDGHRSGDRHTI